MFHIRLKEMFTFHKLVFNPYQIIGSGLCMMIVLFTGYFLNNMAIAGFGSLGIFVFVYYQHLTLKDLVLRFGSVSSFIFMSYLIGVLSTYIPWTTPIAVALIGFIGRVFFRLYDITKPGVFFGVMVAAMGTSTKIPLEKLPVILTFFLIGMLLSFCMALLVHFFEKTPAQPLPKVSLRDRLQRDPAVIIDGVFYASILFLSVYLSQSLKLNNPYWMVISSAAILQGDNLRAILNRNAQRIFGTTIGIGISAFIMSLPLKTVHTLLIIGVLYMIVEFTVRTNYAIANFFTTPLALMLSTLVKQQYVSSIFQDRFIGIVLGSLLGVLGAWIITTSLHFYNKTLHLDENLDKESD